MNTLLGIGNTKRTIRYFTEPNAQQWHTRKFNTEILKDRKLVIDINDGEAFNTYIDVLACRKLYTDDY